MGKMKKEDKLSFRDEILNIIDVPKDLKKGGVLTDVEIRKAELKEKSYFLNDGLGLNLKISPDNKKNWFFRFSFHGKRKLTSFSSYPKVSLQSARDKRDVYLELIHKNINPIDYFKKLKEEYIQEHNSTLEKIFNEWIELQKPKSSLNQWEWKKQRVYQDIILPLGKDRNINEIKIKDLKEVFKKRAETSSYTADKIFPYLKSLFRYANESEYLENNVLVDVEKSTITGVLNLEVDNHPKITDPKIFKELVNEIYNYQGYYSIKNALKFVLHIPLRASNLCNLKWECIDFEKRVLTIPRAEMKIKDKNLPDFEMPLSDEVIKILNEQRELTSHQEWIFQGTKSKSPINVESPNRALKIMGFDDLENNRKITLHGFRGTFRSLINTLDKDNKYSFETKEYALDHQEKSKVVRAYTNETSYIKQLVPMMEYWSSFIVEQLEEK